MKVHILVLCLAAAVAVQAQTAAKPATAKAAGARTAAAGGVKLPPGVPPARGIVKTATAGLRYQDIKVGTGPVGEENKLWKVKYTGYRAADGVKFDSSEDHRAPVMKDGKPVTGADGKPVLGDPEPLAFPHAIGRMIPGFDAGVDGMRVGGKRRIFIPWPMAYGYRAIPDHGPEHPGIPAKSDLIFDVELVNVTDLPTRPPTQPVPAPRLPVPAPKPGQPATPGAPSAAPAPGTPVAPSTTPAPAEPQKPATPQN